ncbi:MAG: UPF0149 family protein [Myxococcota bacterium]
MMTPTHVMSLPLPPCFVPGEPELFEGFGHPEVDALLEMVAARARDPNDTHRFVGLVTGVASAPSTVLAGVWVRAGLGRLGLSPEDYERGWLASLQLFEIIVEGLDEGTTLTPPTDAPDAIDAYCRGYADAVELDELWREDGALRAVAAPMLMLARARPATKRRGRGAKRRKHRAARHDLPDHVLAAYHTLRSIRHAEVVELGSPFWSARIRRG